MLVRYRAIDILETRQLHIHAHMAEMWREKIFCLTVKLHFKQIIFFALRKNVEFIVIDITLQTNNSVD